MAKNNSWVELHAKIADYIWEHCRSNHGLLIEALKQIEEGVSKFSIMKNDKDLLELDEFDPFTFLTLFYKHKDDKKRNAFFKVLCENWELEIDFPIDFSGIPHETSADFFNVLNPVENVPTLWELFEEIYEKRIKIRTYLFQKKYLILL